MVRELEFHDVLAKIETSEGDYIAAMQELAEIDAKLRPYRRQFEKESTALWEQVLSATKPDPKHKPAEGEEQRMVEAHTNDQARKLAHAKLVQARCIGLITTINGLEDRKVELESVRDQHYAQMHNRRAALQYITQEIHWQAAFQGAEQARHAAAAAGVHVPPISTADTPPASDSFDDELPRLVPTSPLDEDEDLPF